MNRLFSPRLAEFRHEAGLVFRLSLADLVLERGLFACRVLGLAAIVAPMLALFSLKYGIVTHLRTELEKSPLVREIRIVNSARLSPGRIRELQEAPEVGFLMPAPLSIASTITLVGTDAGPLDAELVPTGPGDPLMLFSGERDRALAVPGPQEVILSARAARMLGVAAGARVDGLVSRSRQGRRENHILELTVTGVLGEEAFSRNGAFVLPGLIFAVDRYRSGEPGTVLAGDSYAKQDIITDNIRSLRIFAASVDDVEKLAHKLERMGFETISQRGEIARVRNLDHSLTAIFWILTLAATLGAGTSLAAHLVSEVSRKRRVIALARLIGFSRQMAMAMPVFQACLVATGGYVLSLVLWGAITLAIVFRFDVLDRAGAGRVILLEPHHFLAGFALLLVLSLLASLLAAWHAAAASPAEGIRSGGD